MQQKTNNIPTNGIRHIKHRPTPHCTVLPPGKFNGTAEVPTYTKFFTVIVSTTGVQNSTSSAVMLSLGLGLKTEFYGLGLGS